MRKKRRESAHHRPCLAENLRADARSSGHLRGRLGVVLLAIFVAGLLGAQTEPPPDPDAPDLGAAERVNTLIERIEYEQARLVSLRSSFSQRKESELLLEPETSKGLFWFRAPDAVRWDFSEPDETQVVIRGGAMLTWFKNQGTAERVDVGGKADRIMEYLSATNSLSTLRRYFSLQAVFPNNPEAPYRLVLEPRFKRVRKRLEGMEIHLDRQGYFPVYVQYVEPGGDMTELWFEDVEKNVDLDEEVFDLSLPDDVEVRTLQLGAS